MTDLRTAVFAALLMGLSSCGVTYVSSRVVGRTGDTDVRVIRLSAETVLLANSQPYAPRGLPPAFYQADAGGSSPRGLGALPEPPVFPNLTPGKLELRPPPQVEHGPYRLGVGDVLRMGMSNSQTVEPVTGKLQGETSQQQFTLRDDGAISMPKVGTVPLAGLTIEEAEAILFQRLLDAGVDPTVSLEVAAFNSQRISIGGAVGSAQILSLTLNRLDLGQALAAAGGITAPDPKFTSIRLYRNGELFQIPLEDFLMRNDLQALPVVAGDAIYVDTTYDLDRAQTFYESQIAVIALRRADRTSALAEIQAEIDLRRGAFEAREALGANERDYVYLTGEVANQRRWPLPFGQQASLADVLFDSGGFNNETGNPAHIYVLRASTDPAQSGTITAWNLDARNAAAFTLAPRFEMRPDDIVFIEQQPITRWNRAIQQSIPSVIATVGAAGQ